MPDSFKCVSRIASTEARSRLMRLSKASLLSLIEQRYISHA